MSSFGSHPAQTARASVLALALPLILVSLQSAHAQTSVAVATVKSATATAGKTVAAGATGVSATTITAAATTTAPAASTFGTYRTPFAANSLWNSRPKNPTFGTFVIPKSSYYPSISSTVFSTGAFESKPTDPPMTVGGLPTDPGLWDPDAETYRAPIVIPHWPADVVPAVGGDGHADIIDAANNKIHSFWKLQKIDGKWVAKSYAWTPLTGTGWSNPSHYFQGVRAAAVPVIGGLIRKHEVNDGKTIYNHALALSLTFNALAPNPAYIWPATSADQYASTRNYGQIPEGALLMLPSTYDTSKIANPQLKKIADTLKVYGAYVIDQNVGTPFSIYAEIGSGIDLHKGSWDNAVAAELDKMRAALRQVTATTYIDGNGKEFAPMAESMKQNPLSMRGKWTLRSGPALGTFNTHDQFVSFPASATKVVQINNSNRSLGSVSWATRKVGTTQKLTASTTGGGTLRLQLSLAGKIVFDSGELANGQSVRFVWPDAKAITVVWATSGTPGPSTVGGTLVEVAP